MVNALICLFLFIIAGTLMLTLDYVGKVSSDTKEPHPADFWVCVFAWAFIFRVLTSLYYTIGVL